MTIMIPIKNEKIICPKCSKVVIGTISEVSGYHFLSYYAYCNECDYIITESEWEKCDE